MSPVGRFVVATAVSLLCAVGVAPAADAVEPADRSAAEKHNLEWVLDFWNNVFMRRDATRFAEFFAPDYVDHNPNITTPGLPGLLEYVQKLATRQPPAKSGARTPHSDVVVATVDGDVVTLIRKRTLPDPSDPTKTYEAYGFEAMRLHNGKIVEHWDSVLRQGAAAAAGTPTGGIPAAVTPAARPVNSR